MNNGNDRPFPFEQQRLPLKQSAEPSLGYEGQPRQSPGFSYEDNKQKPELNPSGGGNCLSITFIDDGLSSKFASLCMEEDSDEYDEHPAVLQTTFTAPPQRVEPRRHTSEIPFFQSEWSYSPWHPVRDRDSAQSASTTGTGVSSSHSLHAYVGTNIPQPPGLFPARTVAPSAYYQPSYSATSLPQPVMSIPGQTYMQMYQIPEYYPAVVAMPPVPYYSYLPPESVGFSKAPLAPVPKASETEEGTHPLVQKFEEGGKDLKILAGHVAKLAKCQNGSRFLQKEVEKGEPSFIAFVVHEV